MSDDRLDDDDPIRLPTPADSPWGGEDPPTEEELRQAEALGATMDRLLAGEPVAATDDAARAAQLIRSSFHEERLAEGRRDELIQQAMRQALARPVSLPRPRRVSVGSLIALAASLLLVLGAGLMVWQAGPARRHVAQEPPRQMLSRSSDGLMGRPFTDRAGASSRLDLVFADRMNGYRQVVLARGTP